MALKLEGQSADVVTAARLVLPEPPAGAGVVVVVEVGLVVVVVASAFFDLEELPKMA